MGWIIIGRTNFSKKKRFEDPLTAILAIIRIGDRFQIPDYFTRVRIIWVTQFTGVIQTCR